MIISQIPGVAKVAKNKSQSFGIWKMFSGILQHGVSEIPG
jgi:hypothetical protein